MRFNSLMSCNCTQLSLPIPLKKRSRSPTHLEVAYCLQLPRFALQDSSSDLIAQRLIVDSDATYLAWNLAALTPWMVVVEPPNPQRKANALPLIAIVSREGFKAPNKLSDIIAASYRNRGHILSLKRAVCEGATFTKRAGPVWNGDSEMGYACGVLETPGPQRAAGRGH